MPCFIRIHFKVNLSFFVRRGLWLCAVNSCNHKKTQSTLVIIGGFIGIWCTGKNTTVVNDEYFIYFSKKIRLSLCKLAYKKIHWTMSVYYVFITVPANAWCLLPTNLSGRFTSYYAQWFCEYYLRVRDCCECFGAFNIEIWVHCFHVL